jgi:hypothetical protein
MCNFYNQNSLFSQILDCRNHVSFLQRPFPRQKSLRQITTPLNSRDFPAVIDFVSDLFCLFWK